VNCLPTTGIGHFVRCQNTRYTVITARTVIPLRSSASNRFGPANECAIARRLFANCKHRHFLMEARAHIKFPITVLLATCAACDWSSANVKCDRGRTTTPQDRLMQIITVRGARTDARSNESSHERVFTAWAMRRARHISVAEPRSRSCSGTRYYVVFYVLTQSTSNQSMGATSAGRRRTVKLAGGSRRARVCLCPGTVHNRCPYYLSILWTLPFP
jgi:hypothetical protein